MRYLPVSKEQRIAVGIIDYRAGNIGSLAGALQRLGFRPVIADQPDMLQSCPVIILPGVGSAGVAMDALRKTGMDSFIAETFANRNRRIIGICLGMQIMFEHSEEGDRACMGLLPGNVRRLPDGGCHVGWAETGTPVGSVEAWRKASFFFNHSYYVETDSEIVAASLRLGGGTVIAAIVQSGAFTGVQFHPEKSQAAGADLLRYLIGNHFERWQDA